MAAYLKMQSDCSTKIDKALSNYKKSPKDRVTVPYLQTRLEALESYWKSFTDTHQKIIVEIASSDLAKTEYSTGKLYDDTEETYIEYKSLLKEKLATLETPEKEARNPNPVKPPVKLPEITLPTFSGKYSEWESFNDMFKSLIHKNTSLDDVQKLHYLKRSLTGEAEQLCKNIPVCSQNYRVCWEKLESRYSNKRSIANFVLGRLMNQKHLSQESASAIRNLLDTTKECLQSLANLGVDVSSWDLIVIYIVSQRLDADSRAKWEAKMSESGSDLPTLEDLEEFLEARFRSLEYKVDRKVEKTAHVATSSNVNCNFCSQGHKMTNCKKFAKEPLDSRRQFVQAHNLCFLCFSPEHTVYQCNVTVRCRLCKRKHHTLLHTKTNKPPDSGTQNQTEDKNKSPKTETESPNHTGNPEVVTSCFSKAHSQVLLATALVNVESPKSSSAIVLRALVDQGSQTSFMTESAVQLLGLKKVSETSTVSGLGGSQGAALTSRSSVFIKLTSRCDPTFSMSVKVHVLDKLTTLLPNKKVCVNLLSAIPKLTLADPTFDTPNKIDLLLGAEVYSQILQVGLIKIQPGSVIAQQTRLGWIISGTVYGGTSKSDLSCHSVIVDSQVDDSSNELLKRFWELESEPSTNKVKHLTNEERKCEELFAASTQRDQSGRYIVKLPFKLDDPQCQYGGSKQIAVKQFLGLEKRLIKNPPLQAEYSKVLKEYLTLGHMEEVPEADKANPKAVYLPHHAVVRADKVTTKVRVVFNASCSGSNGVSLNEDLMVGPTLQPELRHLVMRWRNYPIPLVADIVKMYRQVKVSEKDADFQRIVWRDNPDADLKYFRLLRVTFGTSSAPYLAVRALHQVALDEGTEFPLAAPRVLNEFYMDDLMSGCHSVEEGVQIYKEMTEMLNRGGFPLQKWSSNNEEMLNHIQEQSIVTSDGVPDLEVKIDEVIKILGLSWSRTADEFRFTVQLPALESPVTKRKVVSDISRLFDPLGWVAPAITTAKVIIQKIWLSGVQWDEVLPAELLKEWIQFRLDLSKLMDIRIPRWMNTSKDDQVIELHGFSDASNVAYAAVVYARVIDKDGKVHVSLITSKTRVAPIKQVSIPRLELCGAVLLAKLLSEVGEILQVPKQQLHAWTDSMVVLAWLRGHPSRWKTFVANRVTEILTTLDGSQWSHVVSKENPADSASRGLQPEECVENQLWFKGPVWLCQKEINYTKGKQQETTLEEKKAVKKCHVAATGEKENNGEALFERFSSLRKLTRVISLCRRVLQWKKPETKKEKGLDQGFTVKELNETLITCIKVVQEKYFQEEIKDLRKKKSVSKGSKLSSLSPYLDEDDVLRVGGRLQNAFMSEDMKHPIILPRSHLTDLIVDEAHHKTLHGGPQLMLSYLRTRYWIIGAKSIVRQLVRKCVTCVRHSNQVKQQMMGQLPTARVTAHRAFHRSGVDYAGPISIRSTKGRGHHSTKGYICVFVCMATRAIHLEVVSDMTSEAFLAAFKRFVARRGHVAEMWSDNGTTFVGGARLISELLDVESSSVAVEIRDWLTSNGTVWHFIPPHAPNFGGLWEGAVKSTKFHLTRVIGTSTLTFEEMTTVLAQIEACLNSRPISQTSENAEDATPLTPGHFLVGEPLVLVPEVNYEKSNLSSLKRWHLTQRMVQDFWRRWSEEYLTQLQHRYKWKREEDEPRVGDLVLIKEDGLPPARWLLGRVTEKHPGSDKLTRVVTLKCGDSKSSRTSLLKRPTSKLIKLPITD